MGISCVKYKNYLYLEIFLFLLLESVYYKSYKFCLHLQMILQILDLNSFSANDLDLVFISKSDISWVYNVIGCSVFFFSRILKNLEHLILLVLNLLYFSLRFA